MSNTMDKAQKEDNPTKLTIDYVEVELDQVIRYFVNGYKLQEGEISNHEYFLDVSKGKVVLRLYVKTPAAPDQAGGEA